MSLSADSAHLGCGQLPPTTSRVHSLAGGHHSTEEIMAEALEKLQILQKLQTHERRPLLGYDHASPVEGVEDRSHSCSSCSSQGSGGQQDASNRSHQWRKGIAGGGSGGDEDEDDEDTPPAHSPQRRVHVTPPPFQDLAGGRFNFHHLQSPYVTPLSAKTNGYHLHPDVMHQQFPCEVSMLPVPRIVYSAGGGNAGDTVSFAPELGSDCTLDENVFLADMITLKYLGMAGSSRNRGKALLRPADQTLGYEGILWSPMASV